MFVFPCSKWTERKGDQTLGDMSPKKSSFFYALPKYIEEGHIIGEPFFGTRLRSKTNFISQ